MSETESTAVLYLVATPIGNLSDISQRALDVLGRVALIAAEDTRHTRKLLSAHDIHPASLISYREQNHAWAGEQLLERLRTGVDVAVVSDAGTPAVSDPGQMLAAAVISQGFSVVPIPGACAAVTALAGSGLPSERFLFLGFPPRKASALADLVEALREEPGTLVFYESPKRLGRTLAGLAAILGPRPAVVARELTKVHETFDRGSLPELAARYSQGTRGEVVLLVGGGEAADGVRLQGALAPMIAALRSDRPLSAKAVARLLAPLTGLSSREIYGLASGAAAEEEDHA